MDVALVLTHDCNLGCTYCYTGEKFRRAMPLAVVEQALDLAFADDSEKVQVSFFGGEPLLAWDMLVRATELAQARASSSGKRLVLTVTTNGTLLTPERVRWLVENQVYVGYSIDGTRAAHDATRPFADRGKLRVLDEGGCRPARSSFDRVARGLALLLDAGAWVETISVIDPANVRHVGETVRWLAARGVLRISLNPNFSATWSDDDLAAWEAGYRDAGRLYLERHRAGRPIYVNVIEDKIITGVKGGYGEGDKCRLGHGGVAVAPSGNLYPCERMVGEDRDAELVIGHVARGLDERLAAFDAACGVANAECGGCAVKGRCMSFCACANRAETGKVGEAGGVQCWHEQMLIAVADEVGNELWRARDRRFIARMYGHSIIEEKTACAE